MPFGDPKTDQRVEAQRDLVRRHDLLTADIQDLLLQVHRNDAHNRRAAPECIRTRLQNAVQCTVEKQDGHSTGLHRHCLELLQ